MVHPSTSFSKPSSYQEVLPLDASHWYVTYVGFKTLQSVIDLKEIQASFSNDESIVTFSLSWVYSHYISRIWLTLHEHLSELTYDHLIWGSACSGRIFIVIVTDIWPIPLAASTTGTKSRMSSSSSVLAGLLGSIRSSILKLWSSDSSWLHPTYKWLQEQHGEPALESTLLVLVSLLG